MEDESKNNVELLVIVPFDTNKELSCTTKQFPRLDKESLESISLIPEQTLQCEVLNPIKDSASKTLASGVGKFLRHYATFNF